MEGIDGVDINELRNGHIRVRKSAKSMSLSDDTLANKWLNASPEKRKAIEASAQKEAGLVTIKFYVCKHCKHSFRPAKAWKNYTPQFCNSSCAASFNNKNRASRGKSKVT